MPRSDRRLWVGLTVAAGLLSAIGGCAVTTRSSEASRPAPIEVTATAGTGAQPASSRRVHRPRTEVSSAPGTEPFTPRLRRAITAEPGQVSAAVYDFTTNRAYSFNPKLRTYTASIIKVPILIALLKRRRSQHRSLTTAERSTATAMIDASDNDAATSLWRQAGGTAALTALFTQLGMTQTGPAPTLLEPWDGIKTTALDQVRLLRALATGISGLNETDRRYAEALMSGVEEDQRWGVTAGTGSTWHVILKDGWVPVERTGWTVNTIGIVRHQHHAYALSVLSSGQSSEAAGIQTVDKVGRAVATALG